MAEIPKKIPIQVKINFEVSFWQAIKLRIAGKSVENLLLTLAENIAKETNATTEM